jgi:hypothetical protein
MGPHCGVDWERLHDARIPSQTKHEKHTYCEDNDGICRRGRWVQFPGHVESERYSLENVWPTLAPEEKEGYVQQMAAALRELRQFTAEFPQRVDGGPLWDNVIANCSSRKRCIKIGKTTDEWFNNMDEELREGIARRLRTRDKAVVEAHLQELKVHVPASDSNTTQALTLIQQNFPPSAPCVLTHADLNLGNILVHEGKIVAIIDWELAGYYPWWVEILTSYDRSLSDSGPELFDAVWKELGTGLDVFRDKIHPVNEAWRYSPVQHTGKTHYWRRPAFCKCQLFGGHIDKHLIDSEERHFVEYDRPKWGR